MTTGTSCPVASAIARSSWAPRSFGAPGAGVNTTLPLCRYVSTSVWPSDSTIERSAGIPIRLCGPMLIPRRSAATRIHRVCRVSGDILVTRCHKQLRRRHRSARPVGRRGGARGAASAGAAEQSRPRSPPPADSPRREVEPDERDPLVRVDDEGADAGSSLTGRARAGPRTSGAAPPRERRRSRATSRAGRRGRFRRAGAPGAHVPDDRRTGRDRPPCRRSRSRGGVARRPAARAAPRYRRNRPSEGPTSLASSDRPRS